MKHSSVKKSPIQHEQEYVEFLRKRLASDNFKANASPEEIKQTRAKYDKAKLKLKFLLEKQDRR